MFDCFFCFQRRNVFKVVHKIRKQHIVVGISAEYNLQSREAAMKTFNDGRANILVSTNLCSRALNLNVNIVINYDVPCKVEQQFDPKVYTYRVSRTARFGSHGIAITLNTRCKSNIKSVLLRDYGIHAIEI